MVSRPGTVPDLSGVSILLAEDNLLNQEVACRFLEKTGAEVLVADNGAIAVELSRTQTFDLVLMDLQMPVMDGFEATRLILTECPDLPVVALSAAVMEEDRHNALQAGMKAHLAKPIEEEELYATLTALIGNRGAVSRIPVDHAGRHVLPPAPDGFDFASGLKRADGDAVFYHRLLIRFRDQLTTEFSGMITLIDQGDSPSVCRMAHTLKGTAGTVGAFRLAAAASAIDSACKEKTAITDAIRQEMKDALESAERELAALPSQLTPTVCIDREEGREAIKILIRALEENELLDDEVLEKATAYLHMISNGGDSEVIKALVQNFEFEKALALINTITDRED
jgi:CheY-like chemotaxis protein